MKKAQAQIEAVRMICNSLAMDNGRCFNIHTGQKQLFAAFETLEAEGICSIKDDLHSESGLYVVSPVTGKYI